MQDLAEKTRIETKNEGIHVSGAKGLRTGHLTTRSADKNVCPTAFGRGSRYLRRSEVLQPDKSHSRRHFRRKCHSRGCRPLGVSDGSGGSLVRVVQDTGVAPAGAVEADHAAGELPALCYGRASDNIEGC